MAASDTIRANGSIERDFGGAGAKPPVLYSSLLDKSRVIRARCDAAETSHFFLGPGRVSDDGNQGSGGEHMTHRVYQLVATIGVLGMTMAATSASAVAATGDSIALSAKGAIQARGAAVTIALTYSCLSSESFEFGVVSITETARGGTAGGSGGFSGTCDGKFHTVKVAVSAQPGGKPFVKGTAFASASLGTFNQVTGTQSGAQTSRTITLST